METNIPRPTSIPLLENQVVCISTPQDLHKYQKEQWIYRGHRETDWALASSLERFCEILKIDVSSMAHIEDQLLREFKRRYHQYSDSPPVEGDLLEWLAVMQHHGAPTRLLDFSYSLYVAAYFALETATRPCAIWAMNKEWAYRESIAQQTTNQEKDFFQKPLQNSAYCRKMFRQIFKSETQRGHIVCPFSPFRLNERLTMQKSVFLLASNLSTRLEENLMAMRGWNDENNLLRLIIQPDLHKKTLGLLFNMNVTRATLFPGLDGFAQSLGVYRPVLDMNNEQEVRYPC
jgi:hypothetical protein